MRYVSTLIFVALVATSAWGQTPNGILDFGNVAEGTVATAANTAFSGVHIGSGGGSFIVKNPGQEIGYQAELQGVAPTGSSINSVGISAGTGFGDSSSTFTVAFEVCFKGGSSGSWFFFAGNGTSFNSAQSVVFTGSQVFAGIEWSFGTSDAITTSNRSGSGWATTGILGTPFAQNVSYTVTVVGNNSSSTVNYGAGQNVSADTYDLWVNGTLVGNDLSKGLLARGTKINAFRFYGMNSSGNVASISLDNIRWWNSCVAPSMAVYSATTLIPSNTFTDLDLNDGAAPLGGPVTVNRVLTMISGNITTSAYTLALGSILEGALAYTGGTIIGNFARYVSGTNAMLFPVGTASNYHPLTITYTTPPSTGGIVTVTTVAPDLLGVDLVSALNDAGFSISRRSDQYWTVTQSTIAGGTYNLSVDGNGQTGIESPSALRIIHSADGSSFDLVGTHSAGSGSEANRTGIDGSVAGRFYLGGNLTDNSLPVTMKGITARVTAGKVYLNIATATEVDVAGFNISRSLSESGPFEMISSYKSNLALKASGSAAGGASYLFVDARVSGGKTYYYKVESVSTSGISQRAGDILQVQVTLPEDYSVYQNYPNPFNPTTNIRFDLKSDANVTLEIYSVLGMKVKELTGGMMSAGTHEVTLDMSRIASGVYYYKFIAVAKTGEVFMQSRRMVLMK
jgi:hypothetical protein